MAGWRGEGSRKVLEVAVAGALPEITASTGRSRGDPP
jgi:hypothetical protein